LSGLLGSAWRRIRAPTVSKGSRLLLIGLFGGIVAFLSDALFSFPVHLPANALAFAFLLGAFYSRALGPSGRVIVLRGTGVKVLATVVLLIAVTVSTFAYRDWLADRYLDRAQLLLGVGRYEEGEQLLLRSVALDVAPAKALYLLGTLYLKEGDARQAVKVLERSLPRHVEEDSYQLLALAYFQLGDFQRARQYLNRFFAIDPHPSLKRDGRYLDALLSYYEGRVDEAITALKALIREGYQPEKLHLNLGEIYLERGELEDAKAHLLEAQRLIERELAALGEGRSLRHQELNRLKARVEALLQRTSSLDADR
jgi:tetratricopeptide (TPR) repeat protein